MAMTAQQFSAWRAGAVKALTDAGFTPANVQSAVDEAEVEAIRQVLVEQAPDLLASIKAALGPTIAQAKAALGG